MKMKKIGIIGGMGSLATVHAFKRIIERFDSSIDQNCPRIIIDNNSQVPSRIDAALTGENKEEVINSINLSLDLMRREKVDAVFIACNTAHVFFDEFEKKGLQVVNMIEETTLALPTDKSALILGTEGIIASKVFDKFNKNKVELLPPEKDLQIVINKAIFEIKKGELGEDTEEQFLSLLKERRENFIVACTELSIFFNKHKIPVYDTLEKAIENVIR